MTESPFEQRLRSGLAGAAEALPEPDVGSGPSELRARRRRPAQLLLAGAASLAVVAGVAAVTLAGQGGDGDDPSVVAADDETTDDEAADDAGPPEVADGEAAGEVAVTNGQVPGEAVVMGGEIHLFDPGSGEPAGTVDIAPMVDVQDASSDLNGGWVVCGDTADRDMAWMWFPAEGDPVTLSEGVQIPDSVADLGIGAPADAEDDPNWSLPPLEQEVEVDWSGLPGMCGSDAVQVIDTVSGPAFTALVPGEGEDGPAVEAHVLATDEVLEFPLDSDPTYPFRESYTTDRALWADEVRAGVDGAPDYAMRLFDLESGEELPIADIPAAGGFAALSPDGGSVAVAEDASPGGQADGPSQVTVYDVESGDVLFEEAFELNLEGFQLSYDGERLAVGSWYEDVGPVTVVNLETGDRHTIDGVHGPLL